MGLICEHLRCEYLVDPMGIDVTAPRLSWELTDADPARRGVRQTAYQVLVSSKTDTDDGDLWDSGKVESDATCHVAYSGAPLTSGTTCHWNVRVWDNNIVPSPWSAPAKWSVGLLDSTDWREARWISESEIVTAAVDIPPDKQFPASMLRRDFTVLSGVRRATVHVTARGVYELYINGNRVGDHILAPEWTDYYTRIQYQTFDVTDLIAEGENAIGAILGDGWYAGRIGLTVGRRHYGIYPELICRMDIEAVDGTVQTVASDGLWQGTCAGPILSADILDGECYDARLEMPGWNTAGFDDSAWQSVHVNNDLGTAKLVWQRNEPIRITQEIEPVAVTEPKSGVYVFDMGQNMPGWCRLKMDGPAGRKIILRHAEMLNENGTIYTANLRTAAQTDTYTLGGNGEEVYEPRFTYHGFRYVEVTGLPKPPTRSSMTGRGFHSSAPFVGEFECSSPMLNQLMSNILWTQRANMESTPTDCPQRDERLGWLGDIQAFSQTAMFNMDIAAFLTKTMADVRDAQTEDGCYPDFAPIPAHPVATFYGAPAWGDAGAIVPWRMYQNYEDTRILEESFESAKRWVDYIHTNNPDLLWVNCRGNDYSDWLNADTFVNCKHPSSGTAVPPDVFATAFFAHSAMIVVDMARVLGLKQHEATYTGLFKKIKSAFNRAFVDEDGRISGNTQAGYALALNFDLLPQELRPKAARHMIESLQHYDGHISTGIQATHRLMLELTRADHVDEAYRLVNLRSFPSWAFMIENGATTIWERWDGYVKGRGFQDFNMNSFNHWALGAVGEWMWRTIVGINPDDSGPGFKSFVIHPRPGGALSWARGTYRSIRGTITCEWKIDNGYFALDVAVPPNTTAVVHLPASGIDHVEESGKPAKDGDGITHLGSSDSAEMFEVGSGRYRFVSD